MLMEEGRLTTPILYLSGYLESHRQEYYERLQSVRERGELQQWPQFFLAAVQHQAESRKWVTRVGSWGRGGKTYWIAHDVFAVIESPFAATADEDQGASD